MARQSIEVFAKHREIPLYIKNTLFSTQILGKSLRLLVFSLDFAQIWFIASL